MLGLGSVTAMDDDGVTQKLQYRTPLEVCGNTPRMSEFGFSSGLPLGSDVLLAYLGGDRSNAVAIGSNHRQYRHTGLKSGESVQYNQWGMYFKLTEQGIEIEANNQPVTVSNATTVTIVATDEVYMKTPRLRVSGDIIDNAESNSTTLKNLRDAYNEHDHEVENVQGGDDTKISKSPGKQVE